MPSAVGRAANWHSVVDGMMDGGSRQVTGGPTKPATAGRVVCKAFLSPWFLPKQSRLHRDGSRRAGLNDPRVPQAQVMDGGVDALVMIRGRLCVTPISSEGSDGTRANWAIFQQQVKLLRILAANPSIGSCKVVGRPRLGIARLRARQAGRRPCVLLALDRIDRGGYWALVSSSGRGGRWPMHPVRSLEWRPRV